MRAALVMLPLALVACGGSNDVAAIVAAREAVKTTLRDPSSAEFRNEKVASYQGRQVICGEVNSDNAFGGKSGFQRYVSNGGDATVVEELMSAEEFAKVWAAVGC